MKPADAYGSDWRLFLGGFAALWVMLDAMGNFPATTDFAAAVALSIAGGATVLYLPTVLANMKLVTQTEGGTSTSGTTQ